MARQVRPAVYGEECPYCKAVNYFDVDDPDGDLSGHDAEGLKCWDCKKTWLLPGSEEWTTLANAYIEDGRNRV